MSRDRSGSNQSKHKLSLSSGSSVGQHQRGKKSVSSAHGSNPSGHRQTESVISGSTVVSRKKVTTVPPFARHDPPSPPTSPRLQPTSPTGPSHNPGLSITSLEPTITNSSFDPSRSQSPYGGSFEAEDPNVPASWWTFAIPGRYKAFHGLQAAWHETVQANDRLRAESEHLGKDYFANKRRRSSADTEAQSVRARRRLSTIAGEDGDAYEMDGTMTPGRLEMEVNNKEKRMRFNTLSLPGSRRASTDNIGRLGTQTHDRAFTLGPPIKGSLLSSGKKYSFLPSRAPNRSKSTPASLHDDMPNPLDGPIIEGVATSDSPVDTEMPIPKTPERPTLNIAIPPPIFATGPPGFGYRPPFQALSPPTPDAWDRPYSNYHGSPAQASRTAQKGSTAGAAHPPPSPWSQPYQSADYGFRGHGPDDNEPTFSGDTLVNSRERDDYRYREKDGKWHNRRKKMKGKAAQATGWSALRRKLIEEGSGGTLRQRARKFLIFDVRSALYMRLFGSACVIIALVLSILNYRFEQRIGTAGIVGSSPLLTIGYASVTIVHQIVALWRESFGRPIGLWGLRSKIVWVCGDLFFIALWSSDLSLTISDYMSTPLLCTSSSPWWSSIPQFELPTSVTTSRDTDDVCKRQAVLVAFVLLTTVSYVANMVLSLFRIMERIRVVAKQAERTGPPNFEH